MLVVVGGGGSSRVHSPLSYPPKEAGARDQVETAMGGRRASNRRKSVLMVPHEERGRERETEGT